MCHCLYVGTSSPCVEIKDCLTTYFGFIAVFKVLCYRTSVNSSVHTWFTDDCIYEACMSSTHNKSTAFHTQQCSQNLQWINNLLGSVHMQVWSTFTPTLNVGIIFHSVTPGHI